MSAGQPNLRQKSAKKTQFMSDKEVPDAQRVVGIVLTVAIGLYTLHRETATVRKSYRR